VWHRHIQGSSNKLGVTAMGTGITIKVQPLEHVPKDGDGPIIFARTLEFAMYI